MSIDTLETTEPCTFEISKRTSQNFEMFHNILDS